MRTIRAVPPDLEVALSPAGQRVNPLVVVGILALVALALALRLSLLIRSGWLLEGDDALSALMAIPIMDGDRPIMLKNQTYAAAWEPYAMAVSYALFGVSRVSAKLPALIGSLALIGTTWLLAREVAGRTAAWFAAAFAALPPAYVLVLSLKPWAPYTEVILLGSLCLTCAIRLGWPRPRPARRPLELRLRRRRRTGPVDASAGGLVLERRRADAPGARPRNSLAADCRAGLAGFGLGALPIWIFNLQTGGATFRFVLGGTQGQTADRAAVLGAWWNNDLPRGAGLWHPWGPSPSTLGVLMAVAVCGALVWAVLGRRRLALRPLDAILVLLALIPTLFVLSGFGGPALNPWGFDATGRYTPPIWYGLAVVLAAAVAAVWRARRRIAVVLSLVPLAVNLGAFASIAPVEAFQSPYWDRLPTDSGPLLSALRDQGVQYVWMNHWAGQPVMFDARASGQTLLAYDWYDVQAGGIDRFPEYRALVENADRPAFVLVTDETEPELEHTLRLMGISFVERRVEPYVVVIPTSGKVHPSAVTAALDYRY